MTVLLLGALFVVGLLLLVRFPERALSVLAGVLALALVATLVVLALGGTVQGTSWLRALDRAQGALAVLAVILTGGLISLGQGAGLSSQPARRKEINLPAAGKPARPVRSSAPSLTRRSTLSSTKSDLKFQDYEVMDRIGIGGMGSVYRARRNSDGRIVALKVPQEKYLADAKFVKRFYREAEVLKRFNHPNIVRVYDYRMQDPEHYIAMEFLDGESLESPAGGPQPGLRRLGADPARAGRRTASHSHAERGSPRHQAWQRDDAQERFSRRAVARGRRQADGFRHCGGQGPDPPDHDRRAGGHPDLHGPRAGQGQPRGRPQRRVLAGSAGLRDGQRPDRVPGQLRGGGASAGVRVPQAAQAGAAGSAGPPQ